MKIVGRATWHGVPLAYRILHVSYDGTEAPAWWMQWEMGPGLRGHMHGCCRLSVGSQWVPAALVTGELDDAHREVTYDFRPGEP